MAHESPDWSLGIPARIDNMEVGTLKLSKENFPLSVSLRPLVLHKYVDTTHSAQGRQAMSREELLGYILNIENFDIPPLDAVIAQTEIIGDPALPSPEDGAMLAWAGTALDHWERNFPLEEPLGTLFRQLKPLIAVIAMQDQKFCTPGTHPLHYMLDTLHEAATGWQAGLGRAGTPVQSLIEKTVSDARACLSNGGKGLTELAQAAASAAQRNQARADRMAQRAIEAEQGRLRAMQAKTLAAEMINQSLQKYTLPTAIGEFLSGPWYESAQLVLLKFGEESSQWREMSATTSTLTESMQPANEENESRRQQLFETVTNIPTEIERWLLSLQHDKDATEQAISVIEYAHLRLMRHQSSELEHIMPITVEKKNNVAQDKPAALDPIAVGQWFKVRSRKGDILRIQLTLMQDAQQQLLFCNQAGIKVQAMSYTAFAELLEKGIASELDTGASFSRALIAAAGIDTEEAWARLTGETLVSPAPDTSGAPTEAPAPAAAADPAPAPESPPPAAAAVPATTGEYGSAMAADLPGETVGRVVHTDIPAPAPTPTPAPAAAAAESIEPLGPVRVKADTPSSPDLPDSGLPELPMGTWLGFHDMDPPLLAKLALHDKVRRLLIFVNRKGVELRRLGEDEYLELIQEGQVDIMEAKNNFREQVERARRRMQHHQ